MRPIGPKKKLSPDAEFLLWREWRNPDNKQTVKDLADDHGISVTTLYRIVKRLEKENAV